MLRTQGYFGLAALTGIVYDTVVVLGTLAVGAAPGVAAAGATLAVFGDWTFLRATWPTAP